MLKIQQNISLKNHTTFKIGGPARLFAECRNEEEIIEALKYAADNNLDYFILGGGSNILVNDKGFNGLVIKSLNSYFLIHNSSIEFGAGISLSEAVRLAKDESLAGLEWAAGIPGTVGGAVRGNAGAYGGSLGDSVETVKILCLNYSEFQGEYPNFQFSRFDREARRAILNFQSIFNDKNYKIINFEKAQCEFDYRDSIFKQNKNLVVLSVVLKLQKEDRNKIENKMKEIVFQRSGKIPQEPSAGSFFMNPVIESGELLAEFERETGKKSRDGKLPAGWLIEKVDLSGFNVGGARISEKHSNFIVNTGKATAEDVIMLASIIKRKVRDELGVQLIEEVQLVGFN